MLTEKMPRGYNQYPRVTSYSSLQSSTSITSPKIPFKKNFKRQNRTRSHILARQLSGAHENTGAKVKHRYVTKCY